jgi:hypothetical protein
MQAPPPVDLNKLKNILGASKAIMNKVETNNFSTGHIDARALTEEGVNQLQSEGVKHSQTPMGYTEDMVKNSNLPPIIKKAMLENPIPQLTTPNHTFTLDDVSDLANEKPMGYPKTPVTNKQYINETKNNSDMISINKSDLNDMVQNIVNEKLLEFFSKSYNKMLTEKTVKSTISTLIKEGRLQPKKKSI